VRFAGVETTGLNATELHDAPQEEVERRVKEATKRLLRKGDVGAVCLGCAGMSGMDDWVRAAAIDELGEDEGRRVRIVDGVKAGVAWLEGTVRMNS
jgi:Asp/Glu/hydantoin racemase